MPAVGVVDAAVQRELASARSSSCRSESAAAARPGCGRSSPPEHRIELAEQAGRLVVPAPPQVLRERRQPLMRRRDELPERPRLADDRRELRAGRGQHAARRPALKARGSIVCTTSTPCSRPRSMSGTPRNERYGSSPASRKYLKRGCVVASATTCGRSCSATRPASPSVEPHAHAADALGPQADRSPPARGSRDPARAGRPSRRRCRTAAESDGRRWSAFRRGCRSVKQARRAFSGFQGLALSWLAVVTSGFKARSLRNRNMQTCRDATAIPTAMSRQRRR